jgi:hypothetical protein
MLSFEFDSCIGKQMYQIKESISLCVKQFDNELKPFATTTTITGFNQLI